MRKLSLLALLFLSFLYPALATSPPTYSIQAEPFATDFGNQFSYYHVKLDLADFTRVARNGLLQIQVEFQKGMEVKETQFQKKTNGAVYYSTDLTTPIYKAKVSDLGGNVLLEKTYGGFDKSVDFGRERSYPESTLATKWLNEKDQYLQKIEFQSLDFTDLQMDLMEILAQTPLVEPVREVAQPKRPEKIRLPVVALNPAATDRETTEKGAVETPPNEDVIIPQNQNHTTAAPEQVEVNAEAAAREEEMLKDPFAELKEPLIDEAESAPSAPVDHEAAAQREQQVATQAKTPSTTTAETTTPVLSDRRNILKLNLPNLSFGNITLNYERVLSAQTSAALNVGFIPAQTSPSLLNEVVDANEATPTTLSGLTATIEYRMYGKKGATRGFYLAPYARYASHQFKYDSIIEGNYTNTDFQLSAVGVGGQIGMQWLIKDRIAIDWGIIGLAAQWYNAKATFRAVEQEIRFDDIRAELEQAIEDSPLSNKLEFTSTEDALEAQMPFLFGGLRTQLSVGYKF